MKQPVLKEMVDLIGTAVLSRVESGLDKFDARSAAAAAENITGVWFSTKCPRTTVCYKRMEFILNTKKKLLLPLNASHY